MNTMITSAVIKEENKSGGSNSNLKANPKCQIREYTIYKRKYIPAFTRKKETLHLDGIFCMCV